MSDYGSEAEEEKELDLSNDVVVTKYKAAAEVTNGALAAVIKACRPGAKIVDICTLGDQHIENAVSKVFKGKNVEKGIAFPTCVSVNSIVCHFSPLVDDATTLKEGDLAKIDLGTHIDGFVATAAHSLVVQEDPEAPVRGKAADAIAAATTALEAAIRLIRPGKSISEVAGPLGKIVDSYGCTLVEGVLSHQLKQFIIDANKCVLSKPGPEAKVEDGEFEENEVSTGEGKTRVLDEKETTVYKRALDEQYHLKLKASRLVFTEINKRFPTMPFSLRLLDNKTSRLGLVECLGHGLLHPYPVLHEKGGGLVAHFKATVLLMPNGSDRITAAPLQRIESERAVEDPELKKLLLTSLKSKTKKKKPRKAKAGSTKTGNGAADDPEAEPEAMEAE